MSSLEQQASEERQKRQMNCALDLMRRMPPQQTQKNLADVIDMVPELCDDLLAAVDQPLQIMQCPDSGKDYLLCDYNRDCDSFRSPWSNKYNPPLADGNLPSDKMRDLEIKANDAFDRYRDMYFEGGLSSVYFWELGKDIAGVVLIKKQGDKSGKCRGSWDSIHVIEITDASGGHMATYKLTSTVMLWLQTNKPESGTMNLGGSVMVQSEKKCSVDQGHVVNIGQLVEDQESRIRSKLEAIYFGKTKDYVNRMRSVVPLKDIDNMNKLQRGIARDLMSRKG